MTTSLEWSNSPVWAKKGLLQDEYPAFSRPCSWETLRKNKVRRAVYFAVSVAFGKQARFASFLSADNGSDAIFGVQPCSEVCREANVTKHKNLALNGNEPDCSSCIAPNVQTETSQLQSLAPWFLLLPPDATKTLRLVARSWFWTAVPATLNGSKSHWRVICLIRRCFCTGPNGCVSHDAPPCIVRRTDSVVQRAVHDPPPPHTHTHR